MKGVLSTMKQVIGIIRRIDERGRIAIPKTFRDKLKIEEGQPFEIFMTKDGFVINVYQPKHNKGQIATEWLNHNQQLMNRHRPQFSYCGRYTCCIAISPQQDYPFSIGRAVCAGGDEYNRDIGNIISFCRAIGKPELIPKEFYE